MPEFRQLLSGMSMMRYFPASGTAGLARSLVSGHSRAPRPPPRISPNMSRLAISAPDVPFDLQVQGLLRGRALVIRQILQGDAQVKRTASLGAGQVRDDGLIGRDPEPLEQATDVVPAAALHHTLLLSLQNACGVSGCCSSAPASPHGPQPRRQQRAGGS